MTTGFFIQRYRGVGGVKVPVQIGVSLDTVNCQVKKPILRPSIACLIMCTTRHTPNLVISESAAYMVKVIAAGFATLAVKAGS